MVIEGSVGGVDHQCCSGPKLLAVYQGVRACKSMDIDVPVLVETEVAGAEFLDAVAERVVFY